MPHGGDSKAKARPASSADTPASADRAKSPAAAATRLQMPGSATEEKEERPKTPASRAASASAPRLGRASLQVPDCDDEAAAGERESSEGTIAPRSRGTSPSAVRGKLATTALAGAKSRSPSADRRGSSISLNKKVGNDDYLEQLSRTGSGLSSLTLSKQSSSQASWRTAADASNASHDSGVGTGSGGASREKEKEGAGAGRSPKPSPSKSGSGARTRTPSERDETKDASPRRVKKSSTSGMLSLVSGCAVWGVVGRVLVGWRVSSCCGGNALTLGGCLLKIANAWETPP